MKVADSPGDRRQVGFGQRPHHACGFHRAQGRAHLRHALENGGGLETVFGHQRAAVGGERVGVVEVHHGGAVVHAGAEIDAHLLDDVASHFGDSDLQHDLVAAAYDDGIDDLVGTADQPRRDVAGLLGLDRARHRAGQQHAFADAFDVDARQALPQRCADAVEVALDRDVVGGDLLAVAVEEHDVGLADVAADDIGALRRADHGVGDLGIGDQHVLGLARQVDDHGFAGAERKEARLDRSGVDRAGRGQGLDLESGSFATTGEGARWSVTAATAASASARIAAVLRRQLIVTPFHLCVPLDHFCVVVVLWTP